jgi:peptidyl-prolyl cis-trans isomerase A (cyclophilin A)
MRRKATGWVLAAVLICIAATAMAQDKTQKSTSKANPKVAIETSLGSIVVELYADKTPLTVKNFLQYVKDKHYDGLIFHRVIGGFMVQGGGVTADFAPRQVRAPIQLEAGRGLSNVRGTLAMARTADPNSATSQFFFNLVDNQRLDDYGGGYAVFGKVIKGMDVVDAIAKVRTKPQAGNQNAPEQSILIKHAKIVK